MNFTLSFLIDVLAVACFQNKTFYYKFLMYFILLPLINSFWLYQTYIIWRLIKPYPAYNDHSHIHKQLVSGLTLSNSASHLAPTCLTTFSLTLNNSKAP